MQMSFSSNSLTTSVAARRGYSFLTCGTWICRGPLANHIQLLQDVTMAVEHDIRKGVIGLLDPIDRNRHFHAPR